MNSTPKQVSNTPNQLNQLTPIKIDQVHQQKQDLANDHTHDQTQPSFLQHSHVQNTQTTNLLCSAKNKAFLLCLNPNCQSIPSFTCVDHNCQCQNQHPLCMSGKLQKALQIINSKVLNNAQIKNHIEQFFNRIIGQIQNFRTSFLSSSYTKIQQCQLHQSQRKLLHISQNKLQNTSINSKQTSQIWGNISKKIKQSQVIFDQVKRHLQIFEKGIKNEIQKLNISVSQTIQRQKQGKIYPHKFYQQLSSKSSIVTNTDLCYKLIQMIPQKVKKIDLLYQASKNEFSLPKFYQLCGDKENLLFVTKTNKDKIFGAFTPECLYNGRQQWVTDSQKRSFLFSLSENEKFLLDNSNYAIYRYADTSQLIGFGDDFDIYDKANITCKCRVGFQRYYKNDKYKNDNESYLKLNGNETPNCTLKEWEVYKIQFE